MLRYHYIAVIVDITILLCCDTYRYYDSMKGINTCGFASAGNSRELRAGEFNGLERFAAGWLDSRARDPGYWLPFY